MKKLFPGMGHCTNALVGTLFATIDFRSCNLNRNLSNGQFYLLVTEILQTKMRVYSYC